MSAIKGKDTKLEMAVRRGLFAQGLRYRLHRKELPGTPDLVFQKYETVLFVNSCFWHGHNCKLFKYPSKDHERWKKKLDRNMENDVRNIARLEADGWRVLTIWECEIRRKKKEHVAKVLQSLGERIRSSLPH